MRAPRTRRPLRADNTTRGIDYCTVSRAQPDDETKPGRLIVSVPLTQRGAVFLDRRQTASEIVGVLFAADELISRTNRETFPTAQEVVARYGPRIVALAAPTDTPPPGKVGYYSDGAKHVAAVKTSAIGKRLFYEVNNDVVSTNIIELLSG